MTAPANNTPQHSGDKKTSRTQRSVAWLGTSFGGLTVVSTLILVLVILAVATWAPATNSGFKDAAAVVTFVGGAAVAIERILELFWTLIGGTIGTYWPLTEVGNQVKTLTDELDKALKPFHEDAVAELQELKDLRRLTEEEFNDAKVKIADLKKRFDDLQKLAPDNQRAQLLIAAAAQNVSYIQQKYGANLRNLTEAKLIADTAIDGLQNFLATFKDNPGRRLISLYLGTVLGLAVAGVYSLDLFQATLNTSQDSRINIILTGVIMGLGSNPTHEVIRAIQEYKKGRKGENIAKPDLP